jgi:short-subunit dehydrogenase
MRMASIAASYSIKTGLIDLNVGKLTITTLDVLNITIAINSILNISSAAGVVSISGGKFENIT